MSVEEGIGIGAAMLGVWGSFSRPAAWPLLMSFTFLAFRYYAGGKGYDVQTFIMADCVTFSAIAIIAWARPQVIWQDVAILALFLPAIMTYAFVTDPRLSYWVLWLVGVSQFALVAPWDRLRLPETRREAWGL